MSHNLLIIVWEGKITMRVLIFLVLQMIQGANWFKICCPPNDTRCEFLFHCFRELTMNAIVAKWKQLCVILFKYNC